MTQPMNEPVTVIVSRRVKPNDAKAFEQLSSEMTRRASQFYGYLSTAMFRPAGPEDPEYRIIFKFKDSESLHAWETSPERAEILDKIESLLIEPSDRETLSGIVTWFSLPSRNPLRPPPRYKMAIVGWLALYPSVTVIFWLFGSVLNQIPLFIRTMLVTIAVMLLMTYVLMPFMTKRFSFWLYPKSEIETQDDQT